MDSKRLFVVMIVILGLMKKSNQERCAKEIGLNKHGIKYQAIVCDKDSVFDIQLSKMQTKRYRDEAKSEEYSIKATATEAMKMVGLDKYVLEKVKESLDRYIKCLSNEATLVHCRLPRGMDFVNEKQKRIRITFKENKDGTNYEVVDYQVIPMLSRKRRTTKDCPIKHFKCYGTATVKTVLRSNTFINLHFQTAKKCPKKFKCFGTSEKKTTDQATLQTVHKTINIHYKSNIKQTRMRRNLQWIDSRKYFRSMRVTESLNVLSKGISALCAANLS